MYSDPTADAAINDGSEDGEIDEGAGGQRLDHSMNGSLRRFLADYKGRADNRLPIKALLEYRGEITNFDHAVSIIAAYADTLSPEIRSTLVEYQRELAAEKARPYEKAFRDNVLAPDWVFQHIISPYIVDFVRGDTVLELDGSTHETSEAVSLDTIRDKYLKRRGFTVHRISRECAEEAARLGRDLAVARGLGIHKEWVCKIN